MTALTYDALNMPEELIHQIAHGLEDPYELAEQHGISADVYKVLSEQPWFINRVESVRTELNARGHEIRYKARKYYELGARRVAERMMAHDAQLPAVLDAVKFFAKMADLEPKTNADQGAGTGFGVNIVINQRAVVSPPQPDTVTIDMPAELPDRPRRLEAFVKRLQGIAPLDIQEPVNG